MSWLKTASTIILFSIAPIAVHGQDADPAQQTTIEWRELVSEQQSRMVGAFVGTHNDTLILAGGSIPSDGTYSDDVWVVTREANAITWHDTEVRLSSGRAFGASANHRLGMLAIGGTDGSDAQYDVILIRWNSETAEPELLRLPAMPGVLVDGGAAVIGDALYVLQHTGPSLDLFSFDLSRIQTDDTGAPVGDRGNAVITDSQDEMGRSVDTWKKLPSLSVTDLDAAAARQVAVAAQNSGRGNQLFVVVRESEISELWAFNPNAPEATAWERQADVPGNIDLNHGALVPLGQSHILMLTGPDTQGVRKALSYNAITGAWAAYNGSPPLAGTIDATVTTDLVRWGDNIVLVSGNTDPDSDSAVLWAIDVNGPTLTFGRLNMTVLVVYLLSMVMVGVYFVFKNSDTNDYFRGGQSIPWWAAACSIYATMLSSLTYVALPALVYRTDWLIYIGTIMILVVAPIAIYIAMPFFRQIDATSAYEYLSKRFNMPVRLFASALFTLFHVGRMGIVLALTALALAAVTPLDAWQSVLVMGVLSLIYCTLGGVEAVIWTDTIQTVVLLIGAVLCFTIIVGGIDGGFSGFVSTGLADQKFRMVNLDFGPGSITTLSIWVIVLGGLGQNLSSYTADQAVVQRYMTTKDTKAAAKSIWMNGIMAVPGALLFFAIGTGLYAFYKSQPEKLDPTIQIDQIFPTFIGAELPIGIAGLIVAGIFAAAQSTVSTSMNSIATTIVTDFMRPFNACRSENGYLNAARALTFTMGVIGTLAGLLFISPEIRSLMEEYFKVIGMFMGALGGLFVLGVTSRKANGWGALVGIFAGVAVMVTVWLMELADGYLFATVGIATALVIGYLASYVLPSDKHDLDGLTLHTMKRKPTTGP